MLNLLAAVQDSAAGSGDIGAGLAIIGAGIVVIGAGLGIGRIGGQMADAMARQPEAAAQIQTGAIILAALIEGAALFGLVIAGFIK
ncbi:MAG: ATP synthase F0 subunit C [Gemmatimonadota bacterium]|nr:ATP synthase F0 subunit C [Gemmatimonadota bacterium]MDH3428022.1 ATP synthase F0 subunit C [Gemmatimonadota bacterium]